MINVSSHLLKYWISKANEFFVKNFSMKVEPLPEVKILDDSKQHNDPNDILISTGSYDPFTSTVYIYTSNRHAKDLMRSYCHELVHHAQNIDNPDYLKRIWKGGGLAENPELEEVEAEAYVKGNLMFRKFTEFLKKQMAAKAAR